MRLGVKFVKWTQEEHENKDINYIWYSFCCVVDDERYRHKLDERYNCN